MRSVTVLFVFDSLPRKLFVYYNYRTVFSRLTKASHGNCVIFLPSLTTSSSSSSYDGTHTVSVLLLSGHIFITMHKIICMANLRLQ